MKKILFLSVSVFLMFTICGFAISCGNQSETIKDLSEDGQKSESLSDTKSDLPETVPIHNQAKIVESSGEINNGVETCFVHMEFEGKINQLSEWYKGELEKDWQIDSVSEGDFDDWSEFYVDAQNSQHYLSVYLYQDAGSNTVIVDITTKAKTEIAETGEVSEAEVAEEYYEEAVTESAVAYSGELKDAEIAFVCASVGSAWNINEHFPNLNIAVYDEYQFDKGEVIRGILNSEKPDIIIIKECAAYFPPDEMGSSMDAYTNLIRDWVNLCRAQGVIPILTTVVPIDPDNPNNWSGQLESILEYNDWVHNFCSAENISVLDLEAALRISEDNRVLNPYYDSGDGLHPNDLAYSEKLDFILIPALEKALEIGY
jgi:hypothetical protein